MGQRLSKPAINFNQIFSFALMAIFGIFLLSGCSPDSESNEIRGLEDIEVSDLKMSDSYDSWEDQIDRLEQKMRRFHNHQVAVAQGWGNDASGYVPRMGHHFVNFDLVDGTFELLKPEALLYLPTDDGGWEFVAVEYLLSEPGPEGPAPEGFIGDADVWFYNPSVGAWTLHAWIVKENPAGVFAAFNADVP